MKTSHDESQKNRELQHAQWRVSFADFLLQTHRKLLLKDDEWRRDETKLAERLAKAKEQFEQLSRT